MLEDIKKYRQEVMGMATIMILMGHTVFYGPDYVHFGCLNDFITLGYSGVDIFLFLSGFGLFFSIEKNSRKVFYIHRLHRLLPSIIGVWILYIAVNISSFSLSTFINPIRMMINGGYWYVGFIVVAYACYPYLYSFSKEHKGWLLLLLSLLLSFLLIIPFIIKGTAVSSNAKVCIVTRIPIFVLGMLYAMRKANWLNYFSVNMLLLLAGSCMLYPYYVHNNLGGNEVFTTYYCIFVITPPVIFIYTKLMNAIGGSKLLRKIGSYSLEVYLVQVTIMMAMMTKFHCMGMNTVYNIVICIIIVISFSIMLKYTTKIIFNSLIWSK